MNRVIIEQFNLLAKQIQDEMYAAKIDNNIKEMNMHKFRLKNVKRVINIIKYFEEEITDIKQLKGLPGVGKGTIQRIQEILDTGHLSELETGAKISNETKTTINSLKELESVIGIGKELATDLIEKYKITSVAQLKKEYKAGRIKLNHQVELGLKYYGIVKGDIPREETIAIRKFLKKVAADIDEGLELTICGSFRRGREKSGDIDVLIYHPEVLKKDQVMNPEEYGFSSYLEEFTNALTATDFLLDDMTDKDPQIKYMGFCKYKNNPVRRIDIRWIPYNSLATGMLYFTGPYELNKAMREEAKRRKMKLNEYGLYKMNKDGEMKVIKTATEKDVFDALGMSYLSPEQRDTYHMGKENK